MICKVMHDLRLSSLRYPGVGSGQPAPPGGLATVLALDRAPCTPTQVGLATSRPLREARR